MNATRNGRSGARILHNSHAVRSSPDRVDGIRKDHIGVVPVTWGLEVANVLIGKVKGKVLSQEDMEKIKIELTKLPFMSDSDTYRHVLTATLSLAQKHHLKVNDASFPELAQRLGVALATCDKALFDAGTSTSKGRRTQVGPNFKRPASPKPSARPKGPGLRRLPTSPSSSLSGSWIKPCATGGTAGAESAFPASSDATTAKASGCSPMLFGLKGKTSDSPGWAASPSFGAGPCLLCPAASPSSRTVLAGPSPASWWRWSGNCYRPTATPWALTWAWHPWPSPVTG